MKSGPRGRIAIRPRTVPLPRNRLLLGHVGRLFAGRGAHTVERFHDRVVYALPHGLLESTLLPLPAQLPAGQPGYVIFPVVEESEKLDIKAATAEAATSAVIGRMYQQVERKWWGANGRKMGSAHRIWCTLALEGRFRACSSAQTPGWSGRALSR